MRIALYIHELCNLNRAGLRNSPDIVTPEVEKHNVLSAFLLVPLETFLQSKVLGVIASTRACTGDGMGCHHPFFYPYQKLW
jgi:hypothetical protein